MGYTHYWTFKAPKRGDAAKLERAYQRAIKECQKIITVYQGDAVGDARLSGYSAHTDKYGGIFFNGKQECSCEPFVLREHYKENFDNNAAPGFVPSGFHFCKTRQYPYDIVVTACLLILKKHLKDNVDLGSDGNLYAWWPGKLLVGRVLKKDYCVPDGEICL